jgi:hypothetical protein
MQRRPSANGPANSGGKKSGQMMGLDIMAMAFFK